MLCVWSVSVCHHIVPTCRCTCLSVCQTTIMAVEYDGGVVIGADSRTTTGWVNRVYCMIVLYCRRHSVKPVCLYPSVSQSLHRQQSHRQTYPNPRPHLLLQVSRLLRSCCSDKLCVNISPQNVIGSWELFLDVGPLSEGNFKTQNLFKGTWKNPVLEVQKWTNKCEMLFLCCRSGSAADTQAVADVVTYQLGFHR